MLSFIIPAYNEERELGGCLRSIHRAARAVGLPYEVIVVDDASTDRTADIAQEHEARVVRVEKRQIAAVRNAGAKTAIGDVFIFVDADTQISAATVRAALWAIKHGAVGGGASVRFDGVIPFGSRCYISLFMAIWWPLNLAAGCFVYATRRAFEAVGGFDERYFAGEEVWLSRALHAQGKFVVVRPAVVTSARKLRMYSGGQLFWLLFKCAAGGPKMVQQREGLELWYDGRREVPDQA